MAPLIFRLLVLATAVSALPADSSISLQAYGVPYRRCGAVSQFFGQTANDWQTYGTDQWLEGWTSSHTTEMADNSNGFAGAFGQWAIGNPDWSCRDDGSASSCDLDLCDNNVLNDRGDDIRPAYYVLEAINRLHSYFTGISEAFETSAIATSLSKESWSLTFYESKDNSGAVSSLKEALTLTTTIIGIGAAFAGLGPAVPAAMAGASAAIAGGASAAAQIQLNAAQDDTFEKDADLGSILSKIVVGSMKSFTSANNQLMTGKNYEGSGDIKTYLSQGAFVDFGGVDKNSVIDRTNAFLLSIAVNKLWTQQKVFILGGGQCGDNQGIGSGPQSYGICRDGKAWYLYYWHEGNGDFLSEKQWGYVDKPPGADKLGSGDYMGVSVADAINSSLDSYNVAEYAYDSDKAAERVHDALSNGWQNPGAQGPSWEGTFTIPVCDVGEAVYQDWYDKEYILEDYGHNARPVWCGPICSNDWDKTKRFIEAANMGNFKSPKHICTENGVDIHY